MSTRPDGSILTNKVNFNIQPSDVIDGQRVVNTLAKLSQDLKALDGIISTIELAAAPDYTPEILPIRQVDRLPVDGDFVSTPATDAVIVFTSLEFGPNEANSIYQNDYTLEVTVGAGEIVSIPFTSAPTGISAVQQLGLKITENNLEFGVWWLSAQPGGNTLNQNSYVSDRGLGGRISLTNQNYYVESTASMEANVSTYISTGEIVSGQKAYWLNFASAPSTGIFDNNNRLLPNIQICPGTQETVIYIQGDTIKYEAE